MSRLLASGWCVVLNHTVLEHSHNEHVYFYEPDMSAVLEETQHENDAAALFVLYLLIFNFMFNLF